MVATLQRRCAGLGTLPVSDWLARSADWLGLRSADARRCSRGARTEDSREQLGFPDPPCQGAVGHFQSSLAGQQLLHPHPVAARTPEGILELRQHSGIAGRRRCELAIFLAQNAADRVTRQLQKSADLAQAPPCAL